MRLAGAIARAEVGWRPTLIAVLGYAVGSTLVGLATFRTGSYPVLTAAVDAEASIGVALLAASAGFSVRPVELGIESELFLAGVAPRDSQVARAFVCAVWCLAVWVAATALAALFAMPWLLARGQAIALVAAGHGPPVTLLVGVLAVSLSALAGASIGMISRTRLTAVTGVAIVGGVPLLLGLAGAYPPALWLRGMSPTSPIVNLLDHHGDVRDTALFHYGVPVAYLLIFSSVVLHRSGPRSQALPASRRVGKEASPDPSGSLRVGADRLGGAATLAVLLCSAATLGYFVPQPVAEAIPWWLRGDWLADLALDQASEPVVREFVAAVVDGDRESERRLSRGHAIAVLAPDLRRQVGRAGPVTDVYYVYNEIEPPGTVYVQFRSETSGFGLTVCTERTDSGWRVVGTSPVGLC